MQIAVGMAPVGPPEVPQPDRSQPQSQEDIFAQLLDALLASMAGGPAQAPLPSESAAAALAEEASASPALDEGTVQQPAQTEVPAPPDVSTPADSFDAGAEAAAPKPGAGLLQQAEVELFPAVEPAESPPQETVKAAGDGAADPAPSSTVTPEAVVLRTEQTVQALLEEPTALPSTDPATEPVAPAMPDAPSIDAVLKILVASLPSIEEPFDLPREVGLRSTPVPEPRSEPAMAPPWDAVLTQQAPGPPKPDALGPLTPLASELAFPEEEAPSGTTVLLTFDEDLRIDRPVERLLQSDQSAAVSNIEQEPSPEVGAPIAARFSSDAEEIVSKAVAVVRLAIHSPERSARILLEPPHLGRLQVDVAVEEGRLNAVFKADTDAARQGLLQNLQTLRSSIEEHGVRVGNIQVLLDGGAAHFGHNFAPGHGSKGNPLPQQIGPTEEPEVPTEGPTLRVSSARLIDVLV